MNLEDLRAFADTHTTRSVFRLETLDRYLVDSDEDNVARYLAGADGPSWAKGNDWMDYLAQEEVSGIRRYRVHVLHTPLSPYLRYECEWGYVYTSQAGEEIYILDTAETAGPSELTDEEFWLYDDTHVVVMHYTPDGRFLDAQPIPQSDTPRYRRYRDLALQNAVPFATWWQHHPDEWRQNWLPNRQGT